MATDPRTHSVLGCCLGTLLVPAGAVLLLVGLFAFQGQTRLILIALAIAIILAGRLISGMLFKNFVKWQSKAEERFWAWFVENEAEFRALSPNDLPGQMEAIQKITDELKKVSGLVAEICIRKDEKCDLVISADGQARYFCLVDALVDKAPPLEHWNLIRLKPRKGGAKMLLAGKEVTAESIYYHLDPPQEDGRLPMTFYFDGFNERDPASRNHFGQIAFIFLDSLLGERDTAEGIGALAFKPMEIRPETSKPLTELAADFDRVRPAKTQAQEAAE